MTIFFIGMPGSGKSLLGRLTALELGWSYCDLDSFIEFRSGLMVSEIFAQKGELYFRLEESRALKLFKNRYHAIISCGGGTVINPANVALMRNNGKIFYIDRPIENIFSDIEIKNRPLLSGNIEKLSALYAERKEIYFSSCDSHILNDSTVDSALKSLKQLILLENVYDLCIKRG